MQSPELGRLQEDLNTLRAVTGGDLPFDRSDVHITLAMGCCALLPAVAAAVGVRSPWGLLASATPCLVSVVGGVVANYRAAHPSKPCPHQKRRENRVGMPVTLVMIGLLLGFRIWAKHSGAPADVANGSVLFFLGILLVLNGLYEPGSRASLLPGVAAIFGGCMWPHCDYFQFWVLVWSCVGVATLGAAATMHRQLAARGQEARGQAT